MIGLALTAGISFLQCAAGPAPKGEGKDPRSAKLASVLVELAAAPDRAGFAESRRILLREDRVSVIVFMSASSTDLDRKRLVEKYGVIVEKAADGLMRARVPVGALIGLSGEAAVSFVDLPDRPGI